MPGANEGRVRYKLDWLNSVDAKCRAHRIVQLAFAEWLEQALDRPGFEQPGTNADVPLRGDEHNRNVLPAPDQFLLERRARHAWHGDVENEALRPTDVLG